MSIMLGNISVKDLHGPLSDFMDKLQGNDSEEWFTGFKKFLRKENPWSSKPSRSWREEDDVIYFSVEDDGMTTEVAVLKGTLFDDKNWITEKIRAYAEAFRTPDKRKLEKPSAKLARLIREKFTNKEIEAMGLLYIYVMHEPINDSGGDPYLLGANRDGDGRRLNAYYGRPDDRWSRDSGFAFVVSPA